MCGFAVVIGAGAVQAARSAPGWERRVGVVQQALARRGPDESAWWHSDEAIVASSRLIHWQEGAASQPFTDDAGGFGVFNGELFNLPQLQERLDLPGASEIEVLVKGLRACGAEFFSWIDGQFAAVLRPRLGEPFVAVRDRFGIAPLYVSPVAGGVALASNLQSLMALADGRWPLSVPGLRGVLTTWAPTDGRTAFEGISQVAPGELVVAAGDGTFHREAWAAAAFSTRPDRAGSNAADSTAAGDSTSARDDALAAQLEEALTESVRARMRSTTPVSCLISGGIDSTIIATLAARLGADRGIGLVLEGDEVVGERQRQVAKAAGLDLLQHTLTPAETVEMLREYVATRRVPLVRLGPVGMSALARRARREGVRAVLSGEGADEMFAGYDSYRIIAARAGLFGPLSDLDWAAFGEPEFDAERGPRWARGYWRSLVRLSTGTPTGRGDLLRPVEAMLAPALQTKPDELQTPPKVILSGEIQSSNSESRRKVGLSAEGGSASRAEGGSASRAEGGSASGAEGGSASRVEGGPATRAEGGVDAGTGVGSATRAEEGAGAGMARVVGARVDEALLARRDDDLRDLLGAYLLTVQGDHAWMEESVELRPPYLSQGVAALALSHSPADFISPENGKQPVRRLLARLAAENPALAKLDFAKAAFRVDVRFVLRDPAAFDALVELIAGAPSDLLDVPAILERAAHCRRVGTCSEAESMLFTFAASLGVLVDAHALAPA